jgi:hypothetical protein
MKRNKDDHENTATMDPPQRKRGQGAPETAGEEQEEMMGQTFIGRTLMGCDNVRQTFNNVWFSGEQSSLFAVFWETFFARATPESPVAGAKRCETS